MPFKLRITWIVVAFLCALAALAVSDSGAVSTTASGTAGIIAPLE